jgi:hypothetical protein
MPDINDVKNGEYAIVSNNNKIPLQINMYEKDASPRGFGTSQKDPNFHNLSSYGGGLLFDISKINTGNPPFTMTIATDNTNRN